MVRSDGRPPCKPIVVDAVPPPLPTPCNSAGSGQACGRPSVGEAGREHRCSGRAPPTARCRRQPCSCGRAVTMAPPPRCASAGDPRKGWPPCGCPHLAALSSHQGGPARPVQASPGADLAAAAADGAVQRGSLSSASGGCCNCGCHVLPRAAPQVAVPTYGEWLDVYLTVLRPLPMPVGGLLGGCRRTNAAFLSIYGFSMSACPAMWLIFSPVNLGSQAPPTSRPSPAWRWPRPAAALSPHRLCSMRVKHEEVFAGGSASCNRTAHRSTDARHSCCCTSCPRAAAGILPEVQMRDLQARSSAPLLPRRQNHAACHPCFRRCT